MPLDDQPLGCRRDRSAIAGIRRVGSRRRPRSPRAPARVEHPASIGSTATTASLPAVSVPVLSMHSTSTRASPSTAGNSCTSTLPLGEAHDGDGERECSSAGRALPAPSPPCRRRRPTRPRARWRGARSWLTNSSARSARSRTSPIEGSGRPRRELRSSEAESPAPRARASPRTRRRRRGRHHAARAGRDERTAEHPVARPLVRRSPTRRVRSDSSSSSPSVTSTSPSTTICEPGASASTSSRPRCRTGNSRTPPVPDHLRLGRGEQRSVDPACASRGAPGRSRSRRSRPGRTRTARPGTARRSMISEHRAEQRVEPREHVRADDLGDGPGRGRGTTLTCAARDALGDLGRAQPAGGIDRDGSHGWHASSLRWAPCRLGCWRCSFSPRSTPSLCSP